MTPPHTYLASLSEQDLVVGYHEAVRQHSTSAMAYIQAELHRRNATKSCTHAYVNVGFTSIKMVCRKCDKEQQS